MLGRSKACRTIFASGKISGQHAVIYRTAGRVLVEDRSRFGTFVNGELVGKGGSVPVRQHGSSNPIWKLAPHTCPVWQEGLGAGAPPRPYGPTWQPSPPSVPHKATLALPSWAGAPRPDLIRRGRPSRYGNSHPTYVPHMAGAPRRPDLVRRGRPSRGDRVSNRAQLFGALSQRGRAHARHTRKRAGRHAVARRRLLRWEAEQRLPARVAGGAAGCTALLSGVGGVGHVGRLV